MSTPHVDLTASPHLLPPHTHTPADTGAAATEHTHSEYAAVAHSHTPASIGAAPAGHSHDYVPGTRQITAGSGLSGGGTLAANRTLSVTYGTTAGTAAQGNDSRIAGSEQAANKDRPNGYPGLDGARRVAVAAIPAVLCQARAITDQGLSSGWNQVALDAEDFDDDNVHSTSSNSGRFVMARSGVYRVSAGLAWKTGQSTAGPARQARLVLNGLAVPPAVVTGYYGVNGYSLIIPPILIPINAGQHVELQAAASLSGAILNGGGNNDYASWMTTELVRTL